MPSKITSKSAVPVPEDDLDNFFLDPDLDAALFGSPKDSNKRKSPGDVNVDDEVSVAKKARVPRIKLDQERLLSQKGIPALRKRAKDLKLKGKGHEWGDASRLLSFYQEWLDDLFPKAKFVDALAMVEKAGHNKVMHNHRVEWINEGRPKMNSMQDDGDVGGATENQPGDSVLKQATRVAPIFDQPASGRPKTPDLDDLFDDDIYNATPAAVRKSVPVAMTNGDEPDEDELDALMAMDESSRPSLPIKPASGAVKSLFGDGKPKAGPRAGPQPDELDEWDALMAEAENGPPRQEAKQPLVATQQPAQSGGAANGDEDDLDALMAEAEAESAPAKPGPTVAPTLSDDEEAMAEMDGLW